MWAVATPQLLRLLMLRLIGPKRKLLAPTDQRCAALKATLQENAVNMSVIGWLDAKRWQHFFVSAQHLHQREWIVVRFAFRFLSGVFQYARKNLRLVRRASRPDDAAH